MRKKFKIAGKDFEAIRTVKQPAMATKKPPAKSRSGKSTSKSARSKSKASVRKSAPKKSNKWSKRVNETSDAMDLKEGVFKGNDPKKIAKSISLSARHSKRKKGTPYQSAMSMLNFYINRGGKNLSASKKRVLERSKDELKKIYHREEK
ncbi:MAG: DUF3175 domain-containing protein [Flavisolibacter sp.]